MTEQPLAPSSRQRHARASFEAALRSARELPVHDGGLWSALCEKMGTDVTTMGELLVEYANVCIVDDQALARAVCDTSGGPPSGTGPVCVSIDGMRYLIADDPWSQDAMLAQLVSGPGVKLAVARPGQMECLLRSFAPPARSTQGGEIPRSAVIDFVDGAIVGARELGASDIHFETSRSGIATKYRLDGVMVPGRFLADAARAEEVISRIKVLAQLDITERRRPQDGRIHWNRAGSSPTDLRVSIMPSIFGEDAVLRLLDRGQLSLAPGEMSLAALGFPATVADDVRALATMPHGMLLVTGPTGSGKTTTVYGALCEINNGVEKIVTIEDPVEYELPGVLQIPVNEQKGLTFATGLRSLLRHDPDKILVGEIRDSETAQIAVQSSLTGHQVFTTVHANSVFDVLGRFRHFGIDPFAFASALNGIVVQRLLRCLCIQCASTRSLTADEWARFGSSGIAPPDVVGVPMGCQHCRDTGYRGRMVIAEVHRLTDDVRDLIVRSATLAELRRGLDQAPSSSLLGVALARVNERRTSIEEVARVIGWS